MADGLYSENTKQFRRNTVKRLIPIFVVLVAAPVALLAGTVVSPEIDAASGVAAISALTGAVLILRGRRRKA
jgi:hypothetical protein